MPFEFHGREPVPDGRKVELWEVDLLLEELEVLEIDVEVDVGAAVNREAATRAIATNECKIMLTALLN